VCQLMHAVMLRSLTVNEVLLHSALTRLPAAMSLSKKLAFLESVLDILGLRTIRDSVIGDDMSRGISGGQRKRVNIGLELVADPVCIMLDEPTSGLNAKAAMVRKKAIFVLGTVPCFLC
jgi:ABC-type multidrug transport system ATPase subunit